MGEAIGQMLPLAVAIAANPVPISVVVLMLVSARALANGLAFTAGWLTGIAVLGVIALVIANGADANDEGQPSTEMGTGLAAMATASGSIWPIASPMRD